ncbi:MAG TPA: PAS domain-containing protein, partial [Geobacteraceae bacterium]|nr:PAS domain-containing protein [Geobacteraceae bacterium]
MKNRSDVPDALGALREKLAGLGENSVRKTYYPELQQRLQELERFKAFIDHSNDAMFLIKVPTGRIVDVNDSACKQMGWSREEFLETSIFDLSGLGRCPDAIDTIDPAVTIDTNPTDPSGS